jgi:type IV secretory pathway protease TraF
MAFIAFAGYFFTANGAIVLNGTDSLSHNAYYMLKKPKLLIKGAYVAFKTPKILADQYDELVFVKRIAGTTGDEIILRNNQICIKSDCRKLHHQMLNAGYAPLASGIIEKNKIVVFGDSLDSLDSRYAEIGTIDKQEIIATGIPIPLPNWKVIKKWIGG